ncbi:MAG: hypothetical protein AB8G11_03050 [Saprospiraceae bacterium]
MNNSQSSRKIGQYVFMGFLIFHSLVALGLGFTSLLNFPYALETGFQIPHSSELDILGLTIGLELLFLGAMAILSFIWTRKGKIEGTITGIAVGTYIFTFGIVAFLKFGDPQPLYVDSIRGFLTLVFGYIAYKELKK